VEEKAAWRSARHKPFHHRLVVKEGPGHENSGQGDSKEHVVEWEVIEDHCQSVSGIKPASKYTPTLYKLKWGMIWRSVFNTDR